MVTPDHRRQAKVVNFGIVYGLSAFGLSQNLGIEPAEAKLFIANYFEKYKGVRAFIDKTLEEARRDLKVKTLHGRIRPIPDINSKNFTQRGFAERTAVNTPLQGTAADLIKVAMIRIDAILQERKLKSRMTLQVHDELVFEVPEKEVETMQSLVREQMEKVHDASSPTASRDGSRPKLERLRLARVGRTLLSDNCRQQEESGCPVLVPPFFGGTGRGFDSSVRRTHMSESANGTATI